MKNEFRTMCGAAGLFLVTALLVAQAGAQGQNPVGQLILAPPCLTVGQLVRPGAAGCTPRPTANGWLKLRIGAPSA
jgi:hypothetical protein